jgi:hypothetical protein
MLRRLTTIAAALSLAACSDGFSPTEADGSKNVGAVPVPPVVADSTAVVAGSAACHGMELFLSPEMLAKIPGCRP